MDNPEYGTEEEWLALNAGIDFNFMWVPHLSVNRRTFEKDSPATASETEKGLDVHDGQTEENTDVPNDDAVGVNEGNEILETALKSTEEVTNVITADRDNIFHRISQATISTQTYFPRMEGNCNIVRNQHPSIDRTTTSLSSGWKNTKPPPMLIPVNLCSEFDPNSTSTPVSSSIKYVIKDKRSKASFQKRAIGPGLVDLASELPNPYRKKIFFTSSTVN